MAAVTDHTDMVAKEKTAQFVWTGFIIGFFVIQAILWSVAITLTFNNPSHAVIHDYDQKALNWDDHKRQLLNSSHLGWQAQLLIDSAADVIGNRTVTLKLDDENGAPIENALVEGRVFHRSRAGQARDVQFSTAGPGVYTATVRIERSGRWQFELVAATADDRFFVTTEERVEVKGK